MLKFTRNQFKVTEKVDEKEKDEFDIELESSVKDIKAKLQQYIG